MINDNRGFKSKLYIIFFLHCLCVCFPLLFTEEIVRSFIYVNYLLQIFCIVLYSRIVKDQLKFFISPSILSSLYLLISFVLADLLFRNNMYLLEYQSNFYSSWTHIHKSLIFYNGCTFLLCVSYFCSKPFFIKNVLNSYRGIKSSVKNSILIFILLLFVLISNIQLSFPGGSIDISTILSTILAICLFVRIKNINGSKRFLFYLLIIAIFAVFRFNNKREAIFLIYPILLLELSTFKYKLIKLKYIFQLILIGLSIFLVIVYMSIMRRDQGKDDVSISQIADIIPAVIEYISIDNVLPILADNIEVNYVYINSHHAVELIENKPELMTWGGTYIKPLFLFIPRSVFPNKPEGVITLYTKAALPDAAASGYCLPLSIQTESYWNFGFLGGLLMTFLVFSFLNLAFKYFYKSLQDDKFSNILYLYLYYVFGILYRDAGFEKLILWIFVAVVFLYLIKYIFKNKKIEIRMK